MGKYFGTDGVRGIANTELTPELAFKLGYHSIPVLAPGTKRPVVVIGRDTRRSGEMLEAALVAGICAAGADVWPAGVLPTPGVAYLTRDLGAAAGVVISASHNPAEYNGIKFFGPDGYKLPDAVEAAIEVGLDGGDDRAKRLTGSAIGRVYPQPGAAEHYQNYAAATVGERRFNGLRVVVDCANGAASEITPALLRRLGAEVIALADQPDGDNINLNCGSTHMEALQRRVREAGANLGLAHDGDADRLLAVDHKGEMVDGDQILTICGLDRLRRGTLTQNTLVATVMSNLGLDLTFRQAGGRVLRTQVGDRYVLEEMLAQGLTLGGEQSGHVIFLDYNTTGDGVITALQLLAAVQDSGRSLRDLAGQMPKLPQVLRNVRVTSKEGLSRPRLADAIRQAQAELGEYGRLLVRPSGTEPLIRVMAEGEDAADVRRIVDTLAELIAAELG